MFRMQTLLCSLLVSTVVGTTPCRVVLIGADALKRCPVDQPVDAQQPADAQEEVEESRSGSKVENGHSVSIELYCDSIIASNLQIGTALVLASLAEVQLVSHNFNRSRAPPAN